MVVESPAKARTIGQFLGDGYRVMATRGHVRDLPAKAGSVKPEDGFAMVYETGKGAARTLGAMAKEVRRADVLVLATDPDREGEAIAWQVLSWLREQDAVGEPRTPGLRPAGGDRAGFRRPLHRHLARRRRPPSLRRYLLRPRPSREPHQAAQGPARVGPHLLPEPARQPVPPRPAHRGLLADARPARCRAPQDAARLGRVRDPQGAPAQDRRPRGRKGRPHPHPLRFGLSGRRPVPPAGRASRGLGPLIAGAPCPANPSPFNLPTQTPPTSNPDAAWRRTQSHARIKSADKLRLR